MVTGSLEAQPVPAPSIAFRHDAEHVVVVLENLYGYSRDELAGLYDVETERKPMQPRVWGAPGNLVEVDLDEWERVFGSAPLGISRTIHLSSVETVGCTVDEVGVAARSGCQDGLVALCEVSPDGLDAFRAANADHFILTEPRAAGPERPHSETDPTAADSERDAITRELENLLPDELARVRHDMEGEYERQKSQAWVPRWRGFDERLANGEGVIEADVSKVELGSEGSRFFVRAQWKLGDDVAFLAWAWVRPGDEVVVEQVNTRASEWLRMPEFQHMELDKSFLGEVLNVVDIDGDGVAEVILLHFGYEAIWISVFPYGAGGPGEQLLSYSAGC